MGLGDDNMGNVFDECILEVFDVVGCVLAHTGIYANQRKPRNNLTAISGCPNQYSDNKVVHTLLTYGERK